MPVIFAALIFTLALLVVKITIAPALSWWFVASPFLMLYLIWFTLLFGALVAEVMERRMRERARLNNKQARESLID